ncbi:MAG TPA: thiamine pyrophosphate-dependent dehydrogenase E1 component subunit alpha [Gaiellaceae bacterium]|nr:thiamine pyrophosphate-dependent dehydrogenase E1 component subunit alpha [Gaiellaceae bacterium]
MLEAHTAHSAIHALYGGMFLIRRFEETLLELFSLGKVSGTTHTCIGQEANAVGVTSCLDAARDVVVSNHRCHGHYLALTDDVDGLLREILGREGGVCGGKGGSQHLCADNFYSNGVLGSTVPLAAGIALAQREKGEGGIATVFVGDGTLGQGVVYESLNFASLWKLPLLVVVEHNGYAQSTPSSLQLAGDVEGRARAFGIASERHDTTDVTEVRAAAERAVAHVRGTGTPFFLVLDTYRFAPHSKGDDFRDPAEIAERRERDPLTVLGDDLDEGERARIEREAEERLRRAVEEALAAPEVAGSAGGGAAGVGSTEPARSGAAGSAGGGAEN